MVAEAVAGTTLFQDAWVGPWIDPERLAAASGPLRVVATTLVVALTLALLAVEARAFRVSLPRVRYAVGVAVMVGGALYTDRPFLFVAAWTAQHWLVATALTTRVARAEPAPPGSPVWRALHAVNRRPWALLLVLCFLSILLLPVMEVEAVESGGTYYGGRIFGTVAFALRTSTWVPALVAVGSRPGSCITGSIALSTGQLRPVAARAPPRSPTPPRGSRPAGGLSRSRPPAPSSGTIGSALSAAPASTALSGHNVVGCQFMSVAATAWRQDGPADALGAKSGNIEQVHSTPAL